MTLYSADAVSAWEMRDVTMGLALAGSTAAGTLSVAGLPLILVLLINPGAAPGSG